MIARHEQESIGLLKARSCTRPASLGWVMMGAFMLAALPVSASESPASEESSTSVSSAGAGEVALATGMLVGGVALGVGSYMISNQEERRWQHGGLYVVHAGLALAPLAAHAIVGEWGRGALSSILPALSGIGMAVLLAMRPNLPSVSRDGDHQVYPVPLVAALVTSAAGVFDAALIEQRRGPRVVARVRGHSATVHMGGNF